MLTPRRLLFAGSPEFATPSLRKLVELGHPPVAVLTQPDRPAGRGRRQTAGPVKRLALELGLPVLQPPTLKSDEIQAQLGELAPELMIVVAYGLLLPPAVLAIPARGCINVHASILPRWRGASPIQAAILAGDEETGVSIMALDAGLDTGPVYTTRHTRIGAAETAGELEARLAVLGAGALADILPAILSGTATPVPQPSTGVTHAGRISKSDGAIDWSAPAAAIVRQVRAYNPWPIAETVFEGRQLRCFAALLPTTPAGFSAGGRRPGEILSAGAQGIDVAAGDGVVRLTEVQLPGRQRVSAADFSRGRSLASARLGDPADAS